MREVTTDCLSHCCGDITTDCSRNATQAALRAPCSSGRAVVGTTPGMMCVRTAPYVARAHTSRPTQSRHISCAAKPLSAEKLPPTACGTRAHQEGKTSPCTQAGLCYRTALLMCMGMFPLVGRACVGVCVGAGVLCDHSGATRQASNAASPAPTQTPTPRAAPMRLHRRQARRRVRTAPASRAHTSACLTALRSNISCAAKPPMCVKFYIFAA